MNHNEPMAKKSKTPFQPTNSSIMHPDYSFPSTSMLPRQPPDLVRKSWSEQQKPPSKPRREPPKGWRYCLPSEQKPMNRQQKPSEYYPEPVQEYNSYVDYESNNNTNYEYQQPQEGLPQQEYDPPPSQTTEITSALFEFPPDSKLYRCTRTEGDRKQVFYIPVPSHATIADVENLLPPDIRDCPRLEIEAVENHDYKFIPTEFSHQAPPPQGPPGQKVQTVNAKQYKRIEKRREARRRLEEQGRIPLERQKYLYESRHAHAMKRKRMPTGRFDGDATPVEIPQKQPPQQPQATRQYSEYAQIQPAAPWRDYQYFPPATMHYQYN